MGYCESLRLVGSRETCNPAPTDTDIDVLVLIDGSRWDSFQSCLYAEGFETHAYPGADFVTYRKGDVNLLATYDKAFFDRFMAATSVAKRLNLLEKSDRIALFQAVLYGNPCGDAK